MPKYKIEYSDGQYYSTLLESNVVEKNQSLMYCIVEVSQEKSDEWEKHISQSKEWHRYWNNLSNEWYEKNYGV